MLRKLFLSGVMGLGLLAPLAAAPAAQAHDYHHRPHRRSFEVLYRGCDREPWACYGHYWNFRQADHVACSLRERGYEAIVR
jgi:hypothetical protein